MRVLPIVRLVAAATLPPLWNDLLLPRMHYGPRARTVANVAFATAYAAVFGVHGSLHGRGEVGSVRPENTVQQGDHSDSQLGEEWRTAHVRCPRPVRVPRARAHTSRPPGAPGWPMIAAAVAPAAVVVAGYAVALGIPVLRNRLAAFANRSPEAPLAEWVAVQIPWGTVYTEELIFRATLDPLLESALGRTGNVMGAVLFGLWHLAPARIAGDDVPATVAATAVAGAALSGLRRRTGTVLTPALLHFAVNAGGAIAARLAVRLAPSRPSASARRSVARDWTDTDRSPGGQDR